MGTGKRKRAAVGRSKGTRFAASMAAGFVTVACAVLLAGCAQTQVHRPPPAPRAYALRAAPPIPKPVPHSAGPRTVQLGHSVNGQPLRLHILGDGPDRVFIFGGIHGDEPTSAALARGLLDYMQDHPEFLDGRTVGILVDANPDGLRANTRVNANGVDLNRNFPAGNWRRSRGRHGSKPASEPETRAILRAVELVRPHRIVSIHSTCRGRHCNNYDGPARPLAELMASHNGHPVRASMGYPTPGSFGSWAGVDRGIPTITLELPRDRTGSQCWRENATALLAFITGAADSVAK